MYLSLLSENAEAMGPDQTGERGVDNLLADRCVAIFLCETLAQGTGFLLEGRGALQQGDVLEVNEFREEFVQYIHEMARVARFLCGHQFPIVQGEDLQNVQVFAHDRL